jgi:Ca2+-binding RTX toxin-like protein
VFTDAAAVTITPAAPCVAGGSPNIATCPVAGVLRIDVVLGNLDDDGSAAASLSPDDLDSVTLTGAGGTDVLTSATSVGVSLNGDGGAPAGNDVITGGPGNDVINGGDGNDVISAGDGDDSLRPGNGDDTASAGPGSDQFPAAGSVADGMDSISGGPQQDSINFFQRRDGIRITLDDLANDGAGCPGAGCELDNIRSDVENLVGGSGADLMIGSAGPETFNGAIGADQIIGGGGADGIFGSEGDDIVRGGAGADNVSGGFGADLVFGGGGDDLVPAGFSDDSVDSLSGGAGIDTTPTFADLPVRVDLDNQADDGFISPLSSSPKDNVRADIENLEGGSGADILVGSARPNQITGGSGNDKLVGLGGSDALLGDRGNDRLSGGKGHDSLEGAGGADQIKAGDGAADEVSCGAAIDRVDADRVDRVAADCDRVRR